MRYLKQYQVAHCFAPQVNTPKDPPEVCQKIKVGNLEERPASMTAWDMVIFCLYVHKRYNHARVNKRGFGESPTNLVDPLAPSIESWAEW